MSKEKGVNKKALISILVLVILIIIVLFLGYFRRLTEEMPAVEDNTFIEDEIISGPDEFIDSQFSENLQEGYTYDGQVKKDISEFTSEETNQKYNEVDGYKRYISENTAISFLYPENSTISEESSITNISANSMKGYTGITLSFGDSVNMTADNFKTYGTSWDYYVHEVESFEGSWAQGKGIISGRDTIFYYDARQAGDGFSGYYMEYHTLLDDGKTIESASFYSDDEETLMTMLGSFSWE